MIKFENKKSGTNNFSAYSCWEEHEVSKKASDGCFWSASASIGPGSEVTDVEDLMFVPRPKRQRKSKEVVGIKVFV